MPSRASDGMSIVSILRKICCVTKLYNHEFYLYDTVRKQQFEFQCDKYFALVPSVPWLALTSTHDGISYITAGVM